MRQVRILTGTRPAPAPAPAPAPEACLPRETSNQASASISPQPVDAWKDRINDHPSSPSATHDSPVQPASSERALGSPRRAVRVLTAVKQPELVPEALDPADGRKPEVAEWVKIVQGWGFVGVVAIPLLLKVVHEQGEEAAAEWIKGKDRDYWLRPLDETVKTEGGYVDDMDAILYGTGSIESQSDCPFDMAAGAGL